MAMYLFEMFLGRSGVYNSVGNNVRAFSTWRTWAGSSNILPSRPTRHWTERVKSYVTVSAHDKSDGTCPVYQQVCDNWLHMKLSAIIANRK